jgi:hypothetical protein
LSIGLFARCPRSDQARTRPTSSVGSRLLVAFLLFLKPPRELDQRV